MAELTRTLQEAVDKAMSSGMALDAIYVELLGPAAHAAALGADAVASTSQEMSHLIDAHISSRRATPVPVPHT